MNVSVYDVLSHTPPWVFILLVYLTWMGVTRLRSSVRQLGRIWISPGIFIVWGLVGLFHRSGDFSYILIHWTVGAVVGAALGSLGGMRLIVDRSRQLVRLPGSVLPLARILLIFGAHYGLQVAAALQPQNRAAWLTWDIYVSGASTGYFLAWSVRFLQSYRKAPQADLAPVVPLKA
ncbi:MAG: hypothetical protein QOD56_2517 [Gammaproteobacteria bacterium]|jgi:hypothetical protein|nr:hypothetical protein [Gammaproteobacteria bacterium]